MHNEGYDNEDYDYILYVNDWLGQDDGHKCVNLPFHIIPLCLIAVRPLNNGLTIISRA